MGRWLSMLKNEISVDLEPTKPTKPQKMTLVGLVGSESKQIEKINLPKVWNLKIRSSDGKSIDSMTMIDPLRMTESECKDHLVKQFGESRIVSFKVKA